MIGNPKHIFINCGIFFLILLGQNLMAVNSLQLISPGPKVFIDNARPVFSWTACSNHVAYELWLDGTLLTKKLKDTTLVSPKALSAGLHSWFVVSRTKAGTTKHSDTLNFYVGRPPLHAWEFQDGFDQSGLENYISSGLKLTNTAISGKRAVLSVKNSTTKTHFAINPAYSNHEEAETSILFSPVAAKAQVGVGFANTKNIWCYAILDQEKGKFSIERKAGYSIFDHTQKGFEIESWTERKEGNSYIWTSADTVLVPLKQGETYRLRFIMSNRLPSLGKAAMAVLETQSGKILSVVRTFLDDVDTPHPLFFMGNGTAQIDDFSYQQLDRWSLNWKPHMGAINPHFNAFNPAVWRDKNKTWWMTSRTDGKIRWSDDGINWSKDFAAAPPVEIMDPAIVGVQGNPWNDGLTYLASCNGCCEAPVEIFSTADPKSGIWKKWGEHPGLTGCGREHAFIDTRDWPSLDSIVFEGTKYRFLSINEGDKGKGGSTMMSLSNDLKNYKVVECEDLFGNATNKALLHKNIWAMECLNVVTSSAMGLDGDVRVMTFKDGFGRYEKSIPQEAIFDGKEPWKVKAMQTIPGFPNYWGNRKVNRDKNGASWYGGFCQWPSCFVWVEEEKKVYCYWGESDVICLSTATIIPEFVCNSVFSPKSAYKKGERMVLEAKIENHGDADGAQKVSLLIDGVEYETKNVFLKANTDTSLTFNVSPEIGVHTLSIAIQEKSETITTNIDVR